jgi:hypothetical protein
VHRDAYRRVAGTVYVVSRLTRAGITVTGVERRTSDAVAWLLASDLPEPHLPGLYFGESGVAVALVEAVGAGLARPDPNVRRFVSGALDGDLDWPDLTHGAAGQGIAALVCASGLSDPSLLRFARRCAMYLIDTQQPDGSWVLPSGVDGMSGETLTGFAHGVAGIVYFLILWEALSPDSEVRTAWERGIDWLLRQAQGGDDGTLEWSYSDHKPERWKWWCHGSAGIALTFLAAHEQTADSEYREAAANALKGIHEHLPPGNLSQCHGLAGLGEVYLEAARLLGAPWQTRARELARLLHDLRLEGVGGGASWASEHSSSPTADLMVGSAGVVHFLARSGGATRADGLPLLFRA